MDNETTNLTNLHDLDLGGRLSLSAKNVRVGDLLYSPYSPNIPLLVDKVFVSSVEEYPVIRILSQYDELKTSPNHLFVLFDGNIAPASSLSVNSRILDVIEGRLSLSELSLLCGKSYRQCQRTVAAECPRGSTFH